MNTLETYLQQATKGLWGKKKLEVREELTAHILERAYKHQVSGVAFEAAVSRAIEELGDAKTIRTGMIGVHTMPNVFKVSGFLTIVAAGAIAMLSVSSAQITMLDRLPIKECLETQQEMINLQTPSGQTIPNMGCRGLWISEDSLKSVLEPQGVQFETKEIEYTFLNNGSPGKGKYTQLQMLFPKGGTVRVPMFKNLYLPLPNGQTELIPFIGEYMYAGDLTDAIRQTGSEVTMSGWNNPVIRYAGIRFTIGTKEQPVAGANWYPNVLYNRFRVLLGGWTDKQNPITDSATAKEYSPSSFKPIFREYTHSIQTNLPAGRIVAIASLERAYTYEFLEKKQEVPSSYRTYFAEVRADGTLEYPSSAKTLGFANDLRELKTTQIGAGSNIVILKFTHNLSHGQKTFEVIPSSKLSK
jgi:hypothetical protein